MDAMQLKSNLKFLGGMPSIHLQDGPSGRIFLKMGSGFYLGVLLPEGAFFDSDRNDVEFLSNCSNVQERMTWAEAAEFLSIWQQTGDREEALMHLERIREANEELDLGF